MLKIDKLQLDIIINGDESRLQLSKLRTEAADLRKEMKGIKDQELLGQKKEELAKLETEIEKTIQKIGITGLSMKELRARMQELKLVWDHMVPGTAEYKAYEQEIKQVGSRMDELRGKAKDVQGTLGTQGGMLDNLKGAWIGIAAGLAVGLAAINKISGAFGEMIKAASEEQAVESRMKIALGGNEEALRRILAIRKTLNENPFFSKDEISNAIRFSLEMGRSETQAKTMTEAAMGFSRVAGIDLNQAMRQLSMTLEGQAGRLGRFVGEVKNLSVEQLKNGEAIDLVNKRLGKYADSGGEAERKTKEFEKTLFELKETIGFILLPVFIAITAVITGTINAFRNVADAIDGLIDPSKRVISEFEAQLTAMVNLQLSITPLMERYDELKSKSKLTADEQKELAEIIEKISGLVPGSITGYNAQGVAIDINTDKLKKYIEQKKEELRLNSLDAKKVVDTNYEETLTKLGQQHARITEMEKNKAQTLKNLERDKQYYITYEGEKAYNMIYNKAKDDHDKQIKAAQDTYGKLLLDKDKYLKESRKLNGDFVEEEIKSALYQQTMDKAVKMSPRQLKEQIPSSEGEAQKAYIDALKKKTEVEQQQAAAVKEIRLKSNEELKDIAKNGSDSDKEIAKEEITRRKDLSDDAKKYSDYMKKIQEDYNNAIAAGIQNQKDREKKMAEMDLKNKLAQIKGNSKFEEDLKLALKNEYERKVQDIDKKYSDEELKKLQQEAEKVFNAEKAKWDARVKADDKGSSEWFLDARQFLEMQMRWEMDQVGNVEDAEKLKYEIREKYNELYKKLEADFEHPGEKKDIGKDKGKPGSMSQRSGADTLPETAWGERQKMLEMQRDVELQNAGDNAGRQKEIWTEFYSALTDLNLQHIDNILVVANLGVATMGSVFSAIDAYENEQLQKDTQVNDQKKANLKKQLDAKLISQKQYDTGVSKLDIDLDTKKKEIAHKQAVRQKEMAVFNATIALLQAIIQAANIAPPADIIMPIIIAALMGVQLAALIATPVPAAAKGRYNVIGQQDGKVYNDVPYQHSFTGIPGKPMLVNETGNEIVIDPYIPPETFN